MENIFFTNQSNPEDFDFQDIEVDDNPELVAITTPLGETASYAIDPTFKEELRKEFLQQCMGYRTRETN